jgi:hypothetical protein
MPQADLPARSPRGPESVTAAVTLSRQLQHLRIKSVNKEKRLMLSLSKHEAPPWRFSRMCALLDDFRACFDKLSMREIGSCHPRQLQA